jgi:hypothetical protein
MVNCSPKDYYDAYLPDGTPIRAIDVIWAYGLDFVRGCVFKYLVRAGDKTPDPLEDLRKARQYLDMEIQRLENQR